MSACASVEAPSLADELLAVQRGGETLRQPFGRAAASLTDGLACAAPAARDRLGWRGVPLPRVWLADAVVVPVVEMDPVAWSARRAAGAGPIVDRTWWLASSDASYVNAPVAPVLISGFFVLGPLSRSRAALGRLRTCAPVAALIPTSPEPAILEMMRCDYYGHSVVAARGDDAELLLEAPRWVPPQGAVHFQRKLREEQLFEVALRTGHAPSSL